MNDLLFWACAIAMVAVFAYIIVSYDDDPYNPL